MIYCKTLQVPWKLAYFPAHAFQMRNELFSIFDQLCLMTPVSSEDGKGVISLTFDSSFMWCEQFCPGRTFYFEDFLPYWEISSILQISVGNISKYVQYRSRYQHNKSISRRISNPERLKESNLPTKGPTTFRFWKTKLLLL